MPAKKDTKNDQVSVSIKLSKDFDETVGKFWRLNLFNDKSDFIKKAVSYYMTTKKCTRCGAINPDNARICGVCFEEFEKGAINDLIDDRAKRILTEWGYEVKRKGE